MIVKRVVTGLPDIIASPKFSDPDTLISPDSMKTSPKPGDELNVSALKGVISPDPSPFEK